MADHHLRLRLLIVEVLVFLGIFFLGRHFWGWDFTSFAASYAVWAIILHRNMTGHNKSGV